MRFRISPVLLFLLIPFVAGAQPAAKETAVVKKEQKKHKMTDTVGVINGHVIQLYDFRETLSNIVRSAARDSMVSEADWTTYVDAAWDRILEDVILEEEIRKNNFAMTNDQVLENMLHEPPPFVSQQFLDSLGRVDSTRMRLALRDPRNDSVVQILIGAHRTNLEQARLAQAIVPDAKSEKDYTERYALWMKKKKSAARVVDKRINFGYY
jgi:hypothetical protein